MAYPANLLDNEDAPRQITANTVEDLELLKSISRLLYTTKSVRESIDLIDRLSNAAQHVIKQRKISL